MLYLVRDARETADQRVVDLECSQQNRDDRRRRAAQRRLVRGGRTKCAQNGRQIIRRKKKKKTEISEAHLQTRKENTGTMG